MGQLAQLSHHLSPQQHFILHLLHLEARDFFYLQVPVTEWLRLLAALRCRYSTNKYSRIQLGRSHAWNPALAQAALHDRVTGKKHRVHHNYTKQES